MKVERSNETTMGGFDKSAPAQVRVGEITRHSGYTRLLHWAVAFFFILLVLSGFAMWFSGILGWLKPLFGGKEMMKTLHPWFGLVLTFFFIFQYINWFRAMRWTPADTNFLRNLKSQLGQADGPAPEDTGFFNGGQKLYFWSVTLSVPIFLLTGLVIWYRPYFPKGMYNINHLIHEVAAIVMTAGLFVHIYKATLGEKGTLRSMLRGTVSEDWARTRRPRWYRDLTGRNQP